MNREIDIVVLQLPRGCTAVARLDAVTGLVTTDHGWLGSTLSKGIKGWDGRLLFPSDGRAFLSALYDYAFLNGYRVRWITSATVSGSRKRRHE